MADKIVVSLCDKTGIMVLPWAEEAGYECYCVDVQHSIRKETHVIAGSGGIVHYVWGDARSWLPPAGKRIGIVFSFPPCTHLTCSDARDFKNKRGWMLCDGVQIFDSCQLAGAYSGVPYMSENPIGRLNTHRRKPDHVFEPWQYGDMYTKKTGIWSGNGFVMPKPMITVKPKGIESKMHKLPPSDDRADIRSQTPPGFAAAVFKANRNIVEKC